MYRTKNITKAHPSATRQIAQRTCVACRQIKDKAKLVRLVRTPEGSVIIDNSGKREGRGAYLCPAPECWKTALKSNRLEHALHGGLTRESRDRLMKYGQELKGA